MTEIVIKRRRWPWVVFVVCLLLAAGQIAWSYRPLNATEKQLVGSWALGLSGTQFEFHANRRYLLHPATLGRGSWSASNSAITFRPDFSSPVIANQPWQSRLKIYIRLLFAPGASPIRFDGPDRFYIHQQEWVRVNE